MKESAGRDARLIQVWRDAGGKITRTGTLPPDADAELRAFIRDRAAFARAAAPESDDAGIDIAGIDAFLVSRGLPAPPAVIMGRAAAVAYRAALAGRGYTFPAIDSVLNVDASHHAGAYIREIGVALSLRVSGPGADLRMHPLVVHEKAHAPAFPAEYVAELTGIRRTPDGLVRDWACPVMPRAGFIVDTGPETVAGEFLEEGFAEMVAAEHTRDVLGMPDGLWPAGRPLPAESAGTPVPPQLADLPAGYVWSSEDELPAWCTAAFAAAGVELLIRKRPSLYEALIRGRSEISGLRDVARIINEIAPGLYRHLRRARYSTLGFTAALDDVRAATGISR